MHVVRKICIFGAISLNKIFIKICSHSIISWFCVTPYFSWKKIMTPYLEENDSPLVFLQTHITSDEDIVFIERLGSIWLLNL